MYQKVCQKIALDNNASLKIARNPARMHNLNDLHLYWHFIRNASANFIESDLIPIGIGKSKAKSAESENSNASYFKKGTRFFHSYDAA